MAKTENCAKCEKTLNLCICEQLPPNLKSKFEIIILQHPGEQKEDLSTAKLLELCLPGNVILKRGLSTRSLTSITGKESDSKAWLVLFVGTQNDLKKFHGTDPLKFFKKSPNSPIPETHNLKGIVLLDGTWSQAKALWWRNPWLLKLNRVMISPSRPSLYANYRREPRKECVSTIEAAAFTLEALGENELVVSSLFKVLEDLLTKYKNKSSSSSLRN